MSQEIIKYLQEDLQNSTAGEFENDYRNILFKWTNAKSTKEKENIIKRYKEVLHEEFKLLKALEYAIEVNKWKS